MMGNHYVGALFDIDTLSVVMMFVVLVIGITVLTFSSRYMKGTEYYYSFLGLLISLIVFLILMVCADNLLLFLLLWGVSNAVLMKLMVPQSKWGAARASGILAGKTFILGFVCIAVGFYMLYLNTDSLSIHEIIRTPKKSDGMVFSLILIAIGAMTQSGLWPFHRWLISSLNSPTPTSAIMHAGLVNGGGFLLARFSPLYLNNSAILLFLFAVGLCSAMVGTVWKLMQNDVKRMLACSTLGQMGFMFVQCGAGLFPAAIAHICLHGFFKANLFLSSNSVIHEKRALSKSPFTLSRFMVAVFCAFIGAIIFSFINDISLYDFKTNIIQTALFFIACTQCVISLGNDHLIRNIKIGLLFSIFFGLLYGLTLKITNHILVSQFPDTLPSMTIFYMMGLFILIMSWLLFLFYPLIKKKVGTHDLLLYLYMKMLNASQPDPKTIASARNGYSF